MSLLPVTTGLTLDLRAIGLTPAYQGVIGGWPDSSDARQTGYFTDKLPTLLSQQTPAGGPAVHFAGHSPLNYEPLHFTDTTNPFATASSSAEIFAVVRATPGMPGNEGFYSAGPYGYYPYAGTTNVVDGAFGTQGYLVNGISTQNWHVYNVSHDGTTRTTNVDGVTVLTVSTAYVKPGGLIVGSGLHGWYGDIAEFICYDRALDPTERQQVLDHLTDLHFNVHPPDPSDPDPTQPANPSGLTLISTISDTFDETSLDPAFWYVGPNETVTLAASQVQLSGQLQTSSSGYNIDSAFIKMIVQRDPGDDVYASYFAQIPFGSPPLNWGINIHVGDSASEISASWTNDDGTGNNSATLTYDPAAHAYLRLSSALAQVSGDWYITCICEAGPAPGQWTELIRSPQMYTSTVTDGFELVLQGNRYGPNGMLIPAVYLDDFNVVPSTSVSDLYMKMPDGAYTKVGVDGQPLSFRLPDGSVRTWPGSKLPMYMKQADGSWKKVLG